MARIARTMKPREIPSVLLLVVATAVAVLLGAIDGRGVDVVTEPASKGRRELMAVTLLYRHGDRTPVEPYPNDPHKNESQWPVDFGQLTTRGKKMQYSLGKYFRDRYQSILPTEYNEKDIYVRSSDVDRTLMSALCNLAGLYPPKDGQVWNQNLAWQPIPVYSVPKPMDNMIRGSPDCPRLYELTDKVMRSEAMVNFNKEHQQLYHYLTQHSGANVTDMNELNFLYDTLFIERLYNKTLPDWTKKVFPEKMAFISNLSFTLNTWTEDLKRLSAGPLIQDILFRSRTFEHAFNNGNVSGQRPKLTMYSGHDMTVATLLNGLGMFDPPAAPPYASSIMMELYRNNATGKFELKFLYRNQSDHEPFVKVLPGCQEYCSLDEFQKLTEGLRPKDWKEECSLKTNDWFIRAVSTVSLAAVAIVAFFLLATVVFSWVRKRWGNSTNRGFSYASLPPDPVN